MTRRNLTRKSQQGARIGSLNNSQMRREELGQFFTPEHVADLMASMFIAKSNTIHLVDPGAGEGALTTALIKRLCQRVIRPEEIRVTAFEIDPKVIPRLRVNLRRCLAMCDRAGISFHFDIYRDDFIPLAVGSLRRDFFSTDLPAFNAAIVNPPYRKLRSDSRIRSSLRSIGIETTNFYSAFVALTLRLLSKGAELVAITPRSFCNGPYFENFRNELLRTSSLRRLHLFRSRGEAFRKDKVLQENIIMHLLKEKPQPEDVVISTSSGAPHGPMEVKKVPYARVVSPSDPEQFIHIDIDLDYGDSSHLLPMLEWTLADLHLSVSTGKVVDFRSKSDLRQSASDDTAPLIYPSHFNGGSVEWPKEAIRKPNAILINDNTRDLLVRSGFYVLVKRFSSKEEQRRVVACTFDPNLIPDKWIGFENHLNYFHSAGQGLNETLAKGLMLFLNSTVVDLYFRRFSGHTQVNATDLRKIKYPSIHTLETLGGKCTYSLGQAEIDALVSEELLNGREEPKSATQAAGAKTERMSQDLGNTWFWAKAVK